MKTNFYSDTILNAKPEKGRKILGVFRWKILMLLCVMFFAGNLNAQPFTINIEQAGSVSGSNTFSQCGINSYYIEVVQNAWGTITFNISDNGNRISFQDTGNTYSGLNYNHGWNQNLINQTQSGGNAENWYVLLEKNGSDFHISITQTPPICPSIISVTGTPLSNFTTCPTQASAVQTVSITAMNLTDDIIVSALAGYEYSINGGTTWNSTVTIPQTGGNVNATLYIRLASGNMEDDYNDIIQLTSGTTTEGIAVAGTVTDMVDMSVNPVLVEDLNYRQGSGPSDAHTFVVSGVCLTGNIDIDLPAGSNFEISTTSATAGFGSSATFTQSSGGTVWVRLKAGLNAGNYSDNIEITNATVGITSPQTVSVSGTVEMYDCYNHSFAINTQDISGTICAIDECKTVYEIKMQPYGNGQYYAVLRITENGTTLNGSSDLFNANPPANLPVTLEGDGRIVFSNAGTSERTYYLNTRNGKPYELTTIQPPLAGHFEVKLTANNTLINEGESVTLTADVCPSGDYTYEWYRNGVSLGTTTDPEQIVTPNNGDKYTVKVNGTLSNEIRIFHRVDIFAIPPGQDRPSYSILAMDECKTIYEFDLTTSNAYYIRFEITENGNAITSFQGVSDIGMQWDADASQLYNNLSNVSNIKFYLNTNTAPYTLSLTEPAHPTDPIIRVEIDGSTSIPKCDPIPTFTASVCPDNNGPYTYQWYRNGVAIDPFENPTAVTDQLGNDIPTDDNTEYYVIALNGVGAPIQSNTITITFAENPVLPNATIDGPAGFKLNYYEHEVNESGPGSGSVFITVDYIAGLDYVLQYRSLEVGSNWRDTVEIIPTGTTDLTYEINPTFAAEYRVKAVDASGCTERFSDVFLVRLIYNCSNQSGGESEVLFTETFGQLPDAVTWWAESDLPDFSGTNYVLNHNFAGYENPGGHVNCNGECWCEWRRNSDGQYAIMANPKTADCISNPDFLNCNAGNALNYGNKDYWWGPDHTGNVNGGMLFINVKDDEPNTIIYERSIKFSGCKGTKVLFSAYISNAAIKGRVPVNVRLDICDKDGNLIESISSGNVVRRSQEDVNNGNAWSHLSFKFAAQDENGEYILRLRNYSAGGAINDEELSGNDIVLDDISATVCFPKIDLVVLGGGVKVNSCDGADTTVTLHAKNDEIADYITDPQYCFLYRNDKTNNQWVAFENIDGDYVVGVDTIDITLTKEGFHGNSKACVIVAPDAATIDKIIEALNDEDIELDDPTCDNFYAISTDFNIDFNYFEAEPIDTTLCPGEVPDYPKTPENLDFEWKLIPIDPSSGDTIGSLPVRGGVVIDGDLTEMEDLYRTYFEGLNARDAGDLDAGEKVHEYIFYVKTIIPETEISEKDSCIYDDFTNSKITITRAPDAPNNSIVSGMTLNSSTGEFEICENDLASGEILALTERPGTSGVDYNWVWFIDGDTLKIGGNVYRNEILTMETLFDETGLYTGEITVKPGCHCASDTVIPFKIYKEFTLDLEANVISNYGDIDNPDGGLCLDPDISDDTKQKVILTATVYDKDGNPFSNEDLAYVTADINGFYWYIYNGADTVRITQTELPELTFTDSIVTIEILEGTPEMSVIRSVVQETNGLYKFTVRATDGICRTLNSDDDAWDNGLESNKDSIEARMPIVLKFDTPKAPSLTVDTFSVCEGQLVDFVVGVKNVLDTADVAIDWELLPYSSLTNPDVLSVPNPDANGVPNNADSVTFENQILEVQPAQPVDRDEVRKIIATTIDNVCRSNEPIDSTFYRVQNNVELEWNFALGWRDSFCLSSDATVIDKIELTVEITRGSPDSLVWVWDHNGVIKKDTTIVSTITTVELPVGEGENSYSVTAWMANHACLEYFSPYNIDTTVIARRPLVLTLDDPANSDTLSVCEGDNLTFNVLLENLYTGESADVLWMVPADVFDQSATAITDPEDRASNSIARVAPASPVTENEVRKVQVKVADAFCPANEPKDSTHYKVYNRLEIEWDLDNPFGDFCLTEPVDPLKQDSVELKIVVTRGVPSGYMWYHNEILIETTIGYDATSAKLPVVEGENRYYVAALITLDEENLCGLEQGEVVTELGAIEGKKPIKITLDLDEIEECTTDEYYSQIFTVTGENVPAGAQYIWTLLDEEGVYKENIDITTTPSLSVDLETGTEGYVKVSVADNVCESNTDNVDSVYFKIQETIVIVLETTDEYGNPIDPVQQCLDKMYLKASVEDGDATGYTWKLYKAGDMTTPLDWEYPELYPIELTETLTEYTVVATKNEACSPENSVEVKTDKEFRIYIADKEGIDISKTDNELCVNELFELEAVVSDPSLSVNYTWVSRKNQHIDPISSPITEYASQISQQDTVIIYVETTDGICKANEELYVVVKDTLKIQLSTDGQLEVCLEGEQEIAIQVHVLSGNSNPPTTIYWHGDEAGVDYESQGTFALIPDKVYWAYVSEPTCGASNWDTLDIKVTQRPTLELIADPEVVDLGERVTLTALISSGEYGDSYTWWDDDVDNPWEQTTGENTVLSYSFEEEKITVFFVRTKVGTCELDGSIEVRSLAQVPNIITPYNGNSKNNIFMGPKDGKPGYRVEIYNRYQQMIFEGDNGWDGTYRGQLAEPGTYYYRIFMRDGKVLKGTVEVVKF